MSATILMERPDTVVHQFMSSGQRMVVWLVHDNTMRIEGNLVGFDEFMNLVLDDAAEIEKKTGKEKKVGRILLKGDGVGLMHLKKK